MSGFVKHQIAQQPRAIFLEFGWRGADFDTANGCAEPIAGAANERQTGAQNRGTGDLVMRGKRIGRCLRSLILGLSVAGFVAGCASQQQTEEDAAFGFEEPYDPIEPVNRVIFDFNEFLDGLLLKPLAEGYRVLLPQEARDSIRNFLRNLRTPVILANDLLQADMERAGTTVARFLVNTTIGIGGLFDRAADVGYDYHDEDFGQTLGIYGVGGGPYLVLPVFGPSTVRDTGGMVVDIFFDPLTYLADDPELFARRGVEGIDKRERNIETLDDLKRDSLDFYARIRSLYLQQREEEISNGRAAAPAPAFDYDLDPEEEFQ